MDSPEGLYAQYGKDMRTSASCTGMSMMHGQGCKWTAGRACWLTGTGESVSCRVGRAVLKYSTGHHVLRTNARGGAVGGVKA